MGDAVSKAQLLSSCRAVAAADDGHSAAFSESLCHRLGALSKCGELEHAHGAVPDDGACADGSVAERLGGCGTDVQTLQLSGDRHGGMHAGLCISSKLSSADGVGGQQQLHAVALCLLDHLQCVIHLVSFQQRAADLAALCLHEGVSHAAADDDGVSLVEEVVDDSDLVADLSAAEDSHEGTLGIIEGLAHDLQLLGDQQTGDCGEMVSNACGGSVSAVHGAESIGHIQLSHGSELLGESGIVLLFLCVEAEVLQQQHFAALEISSLCLGILADDILCEDHILTQQLAQTLCHGSKGEVLLPLTLGLAEVGASDDSCALLQQIADGGQCCHDALVAGDFESFLVLRHIEIAAQKDLLALHVHVHDGFLVVVHGVHSFKLYNVCSA